MGDSVYGVGEPEMTLRRAGKGDVLGVSATHHFNSWIGKPVLAGTAEAIAQEFDAAAWQRLSAGVGTKGDRLYDWARLAKVPFGAVRWNGKMRVIWNWPTSRPTNAKAAAEAYGHATC